MADFLSCVLAKLEFDAGRLVLEIEQFALRHGSDLSRHLVSLDLALRESVTDVVEAAGHVQREYREIVRNPRRARLLTHRTDGAHHRSGRLRDVAAIAALNFVHNRTRSRLLRAATRTAAEHYLNVLEYGHGRGKLRTAGHLALNVYRNHPGQRLSARAATGHLLAIDVSRRFHRRLHGNLTRAVAAYYAEGHFRRLHGEGRRTVLSHALHFAWTYHHERRASRDMRINHWRSIA